MELTILFRAITISLIVTAIWYCCQPDEIFGKPIEKISDRLWKYKDGRFWIILKPVCKCSVCMCGIWTLILYPLLFGFDWWLFVSMVESIGINALLLPVVRLIAEE